MLGVGCNVRYPTYYQQPTSEEFRIAAKASRGRNNYDDYSSPFVLLSLLTNAYLTTALNLLGPLLFLLLFYFGWKSHLSILPPYFLFSYHTPIPRGKVEHKARPFLAAL